MSLLKRLEALEAAHVAPTSAREASDAVLLGIVAHHLRLKPNQVTDQHLQALAPPVTIGTPRADPFPMGQP